MKTHNYPQFEEDARAAIKNYEIEHITSGLDEHRATYGGMVRAMARTGSRYEVAAMPYPFQQQTWMVSMLYPYGLTQLIGTGALYADYLASKMARFDRSDTLNGGDYAALTITTGLACGMKFVVIEGDEIQLDPYLAKWRES